MGEIDPGVVTKLLHAQAHAVFLAIELENAHLDFVANVDHLAGVANAAPSHIGDVQEPVDATEVNESTVVREVLDQAVQRLPFFKRRQQCLALFAVFLLQHGAPGNHNVVALLVELDDFEFEWLAFQMRGFPERTNIHKGTGQEGAYVTDIDGKAAFDAAVDYTFHQFIVGEGLFKHLPGLGAARLFPRHAGFTAAVVDDFHDDLDLVADAENELPVLVKKLTFGNTAFGFQAGVNDNPFVVNINHRAGDDGAGFHFDGIQAFFKQLRETFTHGWDNLLAALRCPCGRGNFLGVGQKRPLVSLMRATG